MNALINVEKMKMNILIQVIIVSLNALKEKIL